MKVYTNMAKPLNALITKPGAPNPFVEAAKAKKAKESAGGVPRQI
jgi:hypothetical protein